MLASSVWRGSERRWFLSGLLLGATITATLAVLAGSLLHPLLPSSVRLLAIAFAAMAVLLGELGAYRLRLPQAARQVSQWVAGEGRPGAFQFGTEMGTGFRTFSTSNLPHLALLALLLNPEPTAGLLASVGFTSGRALMTLSRVHSADPETWDEDLAASEPRIRQVLAVAALLALALAVGVAGILPAGA